MLVPCPWSKVCKVNIGVNVGVNKASDTSSQKTKVHPSPTLMNWEPRNVSAICPAAGPDHDRGKPEISIIGLNALQIAGREHMFVCMSQGRYFAMIF